MNDLDFKRASVRSLFFKQLFPALLGMMASALYVVVDGIFVGQGVGSDGIAAVNINNPLMTLVSGLGLMFGMGGGVITALHLARGQRQAANRTLTQTLIATFVFTSILTVMLCVFHDQVGFALGADERLIGKVGEYLFWYALCFPFMVMMTVLPFFIRLSNPIVPMWALSIGALLNVVLDYVFIFVFDWGLRGAAIATDIGQVIGALIMFGYLLRGGNAVELIHPKVSLRILWHVMTELRYMVCLGFSVFLGEITVSIMGIAGNYAFMHYMGADGVAAYSIVCYVFPVIFMLFNATVQSIQPIVSYNYGCGQIQRSVEALRLALKFSVGVSLAMALMFWWSNRTLVTLFIPDMGHPAWTLAVEGLPYFAFDFLFFGINTIVIGYYMSLERLKMASYLTLIRGLLPVMLFFVLPLWMGDRGLWLAVAVADFATTLVILMVYFAKRKHDGKLDSGLGGTV